MEAAQILYDSPEAATYKTDIKGWVSRDGHFLGEDEHMARYMGCTHKKCECGNVIAKNSYCQSCYEKRRADEWEKMPVIEWDGVCMLHIHDSDQYFSELEEIYDYCKDNGLRPDELHLVATEPSELREVDLDYWQDDLPEDGELPAPIMAKLEELNKLISENKTVVSWMPINKRILISAPADWEST